MIPRIRTKSFAWIPSLSTVFIALAAIHIRKTHCYDFRLEPSGFVGRGLMGDFGDFDNSGNLDFATYSYDATKNRTTIYIYTDINKGEEGTHYGSFEVDGECDGMTCDDLNVDNQVDILLFMKKRYEATDERQLYYFLLYSQEKRGVFHRVWDSRTSLDELAEKLGPSKGIKDTLIRNAPPLGVYQYSTIHPLVADLDGDGHPDILAQATTNELILWINYGTTFMPFRHNTVPTLLFQGDFQGLIPNPHSSAFIDMNGDCRPDLVLVKEYPNATRRCRPRADVYLEIWLADAPDNVVTFKKWDSLVELPKHHGMLTFEDFNNDGTFDIMAPFCDSVDADGFCDSPCKIAVAYNQQMPFCPQMFKMGELECRTPNNLCTPSTMTFTAFADDTNRVQLDPKYTFIYPMGGHGVRRVTPKFNHAQTKPGDSFTKLPTQLASVATGDFNNNGLIDLIVPLKVRNKPDEADAQDSGPRHYVMVIANTAKDPKEDQKYKFIPISVKDQSTTLTHVTTADVIHRPHQLQRALNLLIFLKNGENLSCLYYTAFKQTLDLFMKLMTKYVVTEESKYPENYFFSGSNKNGLTYKLTVIDINGIKFPKTACLRPQTGYTPLFTPFAFIGLGKTNNYIEEFYLGVSSKSKNYKNMWISIIPSCTAITVPMPLNTPTQWSLKLSIIPGKKLFTILITTTVALVFFGAIILFFDIKERREDLIRAKGFRQKFIIN